MKNEETLAVIAEYFQCLNSERWEAMARLWHEHARLDASGARTREGPAQIVEYLQKALAPYATHDDAPTRVVVDGRYASVDIHYVGVTHDGREVVINAHSEYEVEAHRIVRLMTRYDINRARTELAAAESPG